jgi:ATP-dependent Lon protease
MTPPDEASRESIENLESRPLPPGSVIVLAVRDIVMFPGVVLPIAVGRPSSVAAIQRAAREQKQVLVLLDRNAAGEEVDTSTLSRTGTMSNILRYVTTPDGRHHLVCQGAQRFRVDDFITGYPFPLVRGLLLAEPSTTGPEVEARLLVLRRQIHEVFDLLPQVPPELRQTVEGTESAGQLADLAATYMDAKPEEKQELLETLELVPRLDKVSRLLAARLEVLRITNEIGLQTKSSLDARQRETILREQMAAIRRELGEDDSNRQELADLEGAIAKAGMPPDVEAAARKELRRLQRTPDASAEYGMIRTYFDTLVELPWALPAAQPIDIAEARRILDADHYGLEKIKKRIVEYLAVRKLAPEGKAPILCFVGPPGVGKTSLGQSIARAMGRKFARVSLGGVHDEAEIRGHRRTYIGALPGSIIQAIRKVGSRDCVMMLDEIDKLGTGIRGDPASAMLEVLDPEQNVAFRDNYLDVPFDLSRVVFIATANMLDTIPGPLRDRMEIVSLPGYTASEKLQIAQRYLIPRQLESNGLAVDQVMFEEAALRRIIDGYTREAGVRGLEREIGRVVRAVAVKVAEGASGKFDIDVGQLDQLLGPARFENDVAMRTSVPGVATGLAWTPVGGDILFIEAARSPGHGKFTLTGQLGEVMRESAQAALTLVKAQASSLGIELSTLEKTDIHVHVPAGATPKDGPSAGVAMFVALASLLTDRKVRHDTAMTGEISLRGLILPVGGIKEKVVAAAAAGLKRVMLPSWNRRDYDDIPREAREALEFIWLERVEDALAQGLEPGQ